MVLSSLVAFGGLVQTNPKVDLEFLRTLTLEVLAQSHVAPGSNGPPNWKIKNSVGFALVTPGRKGYPAFWIRDFSMACDSGLVPTKEIENHFMLVAKCQNGPQAKKLKSGGILPPFCIPDHINFDGSPVYYPGTYSSGEDQGGEPWGIYPPADDHYEFVHLGWLLAKQGKNRAFLGKKVGSFTVLERMKRAFESPVSDPGSGLFKTTVEMRAVGFGFCDSITMTGKVLYPSLLRYRAAKELAELTGDQRFKNDADLIAKNVPLVFGEKESGWLRVATGIGQQPDVWGTLLALHLGVLESKIAENARNTISLAYRAETISLDGAVRHVPTDRDFSATSTWEKALEGKGTYQNGAYWHTPTGLLVEVLAKDNPALGQKVFAEYIFHLHLGGEVPWECFNPPIYHAQNGGYLASVAWPYSVLKSMY